MLNRSSKLAFTMLELIFVIVIMGLLGKFGTEFLATAYENFLFSKINNTLHEQSSSAVEFISKRLESRIKASVIARNTTTGTYNFVNSAGTSDENATVLEWIGTDINGFRGTTSPLWSGIIDLDISVSGPTNILSPDSDFNATSTLITTLSPTGKTITGAAVYFIGSSITVNPWGYDGAITDETHTLRPIQRVPIAAIDRFQIEGGSVTGFTGIEVFEYYKLSTSAYAVALDYNDTSNIGDLYFYYDYRPWKGETYTANGTKVLLAENISTFRYRGSGSLIKIQICAKSDLTNEEYSLCKEKTIY